jgi:ADP-L-glycero-D-manno-heptose 6-epimerase
MPGLRNLSGDDLIVVTGGAGFIGSNIVLRLADAGARVVVCDLFRSGEKWRNIATAWIHDVVRPSDLPQWLDRHRDKVAAIVHMAAISSTTEKDIDKFVETNIRLTLDLWDWCAAHAVCGQVVPPQWVGLKFFNVYGPNEAHKGGMQSLVSKIFPAVRAAEAVTLFRSHDPRYTDGGQLRDFVYVKDCVAVVSWLLEHPETSGLFNVGTGTARSFLDLVRAVCAVVGCTPNIRFIDTPEELRAQYQYFTCADITKLRRAGFEASFYSLEDGVHDYLSQLFLDSQGL